ncbi:MAG: ATP-binding protein [Bacilli bacterium]
MLIRKQYLDLLIKYKDIKLVKVITGVRRSGKSILLQQFKEYLISQGNDNEDIIYMNFESVEWDDIRTYKDLYNYIKSKYNNKKLYILLDEIQSVESWQKAVNSLLVDIDCDLYITGSNAYLLSSELTTLIAGRVATIKIYPLSFKEYISIYPFDKESKEEKLDEYLLHGGMPMLINMNRDNTLINNYLEDIKEVILKKDVIERNRINDIPLLENLLKYVASTIGVFLTPSSICNELAKNGYNAHNETIDSYLKMLENAFIIYRAPRYNVQGKQLLKTQGKYYFIDTGLRNILNGISQYDSGSAYENIVYLELLRRGYTVYVGKYNEMEIDFIAIKPDETIYYQVCRSIMDEKVENREKSSLLLVNDNYPKIILTMDNVRNKTIDGIIVQNIIDFLLE